MRLWSIHPKYLDVKGFVALWREACQAQRILLGTYSGPIGYQNHPQLNRFKGHAFPVQMLQSFMEHVYMDSLRRNYSFNRNLIPENIVPMSMTVTKGQLEYETKHLRRKLTVRNPRLLHKLPAELLPHPCFSVIDGDIESWERPPIKEVSLNT